MRKRTRRQVQGWAAAAVIAAVWVAGNWAMVWPVLAAVLAVAVVGGGRLGTVAGAPARGRAGPAVARAGRGEGTGVVDGGDRRAVVAGLREVRRRPVPAWRLHAGRRQLAVRQESRTRWSRCRPWRASPTRSAGAGGTQGTAVAAGTAGGCRRWRRRCGGRGPGRRGRPRWTGRRGAGASVLHCAVPVGHG